MSDEATAHTLFPIGHLTKPEVKKIAAERGLDVATKKESMGICFVGEVGIKDFLSNYLKTIPGEIREVETDQILGYHDGAIFYTIGQRHGLYLGGGLPYYVVKKDLSKNLVYVSRDLNHPELWADQLALTDLHLRNGHTLADLAKIPDLTVRLRHRGELIPCSIAFAKEATQTPSKEDKRAVEPTATSDDHVKTGGEASLLSEASVRLLFHKSVKRPASGQSAVLYSGEVCLGGGYIA